jgi:hypothetical protein
MLPSSSSSSHHHTTITSSCRDHGHYITLQPSCQHRVSRISHCLPFLAIMLPPSNHHVMHHLHRKTKPCNKSFASFAHTTVNTQVQNFGGSVALAPTANKFVTLEVLTSSGGVAPECIQGPHTVHTLLARNALRGNSRNSKCALRQRESECTGPLPHSNLCPKLHPRISYFHGPVRVTCVRGKCGELSVAPETNNKK